MTRRIPSN